MPRPQAILPSDRRKQDLKAIHAGARQLNLDEDTRRDLIERVTGYRSAGQLDDAGRAAVLQELRRLGAGRPGAKKPAHYPGRPHNFARLDAEITKIEAQLADMKLPWSYADAIARRMFRIQRVAWLRKQEQLVAVLSALHNEQLKRDLGAEIDRALKQLGMTEAQINGPKNWRRNLPALKGIAEALGNRIETQLTQQQEETGHDPKPQA